MLAGRIRAPSGRCWTSWRRRARRHFRCCASAGMPWPSATDFLRSRELVTVFDDPIDVVAMPEIDRGGPWLSVARPVRSSHTAARPSFAVSPTPAGWSVDQVRSFYREYNRHMLHDLVAHEAMPGHALTTRALQPLSRAPAPIRAVWWSAFVRGRLGGLRRGAHGRSRVSSRTSPPAPVRLCACSSSRCSCA